MVGAEGSTWIMFQWYSGPALIMAFFLVSLMIVWAVEKNKGMKAVLVYLPILTLILFFFPLLSNFVIKTLDEEEVYYRILWLLPVSIVLPYIAAKAVFIQKKRWQRALLGSALALTICVGGNYVYDNPLLSKAENEYQLPQEVIDICDEIIIPGREVKAVFPHELVQYVRQYTALVVLPYGYDTLVERWNLEDDLEDEMCKEVSDAALLAMLSRERGCHYIILNQEHSVAGDLSDYEYSLVKSVDGYDIYVDDNAYLGLWDK